MWLKCFQPPWSSACPRKTCNPTCAPSDLGDWNRPPSCRPRDCADILRGLSQLRSSHGPWPCAVSTHIRSLQIKRCKVIGYAVTWTSKMSADAKVPGEVSLEWERLKALRSHRERLLNTKYRPLDRTKVLQEANGIETKNDASLLEDGLRNIMRRIDLDILFNNGLDAHALAQATASMETLCLTLEGLVNSSLLSEQPLPNDSKYPKLDNLLRTLAATKWKFAMISGSRKLFRTADPGAMKLSVDEFNTLFDRLTQRDTGALRVNDSKHSAGGGANVPRQHLHKAIKSLQTLLSWISKLANCRGNHDVLLQLPEWDTATSAERFRQSHLDLYLSTPCCKPSSWQESRLRELETR